MPKVFITSKISENGISLLKSKGFAIDSNAADNLFKEDYKRILGKYDAVLTTITDKIDKEVLDSSGKNLKIISNYAVGYDNIDIETAVSLGIIVTNTPGVASESVAEHTFAMILALNKQIRVADKFVRSGNFKGWNPNAFLSHQIWGQTIGIIGLGRIGTFVGQIAYGGFRMDILYNDLFRSEDFELLTDAKFASIDEILRSADIITLHVPLTFKTRHLIGKSELSKMKKSAILINTARGQVVDEDALVWALEHGKIAAAGLDVFEHEPNVSKALLSMDNVALTPHNASSTFETRERMSEIAAQNIIDVFEGRKPLGLIKD